MKPVKIIAFSIMISLLAAGCSLFGQAPTAGVIKSNNGGSDWQFAGKISGSKTESLAGLSISSLAFDPTNSQHLFAGSYTGGVYRSEDGAGSWQRILSAIAIYDIAVHPLDPKTVYAAGQFNDHGRLLRTQDGGKSWIEVFQEGSLKNAVRSVAINPANALEVIIGLQQGTVVKSSDGGTTWRLLQSYEDRVNMIRWQPDGVYVLLQSKGLFRSSDGGNSFQALTGPLLPKNTFSDIFDANAYVSGFNRFAVSAVNPSLIYVTTNAGLYRTTAAGSQWEKVSLPLRQKDIPTWTVTLAQSSDSTLYVSAGATVYKSVDGGLSWQTQETHTTNLINVILADPRLPQIVYAGIYAP